jgi:tetratricopeptide (TPR) repeat protein
MRNVRVFISSPGDLHEQRRMVAQEIEELNKRAGFRDRYKFVAYLYEQLAPAMTGDGPQDVVNEQMLRPSDADIVVCMLWSRIGTPLAEINPDTGQPYASGTEYEFYDAYRSYRRRRKPTLLMYRCQAPHPADTDPKQLAYVMSFFERFSGANAKLRGLYKPFATADELRDMAIQDIESVIANWERPSQRFMDQVLRPLWPLFALLIVGLVILGVLLSRAGGEDKFDVRSFNVAIAGFAVDPQSQVNEADVKILSEAFYNDFASRMDAVKSELNITQDIGIWKPEQVGIVSGSDKEQRARNAQELVKRLRETKQAPADILVYGVVTRQDNNVVISPEFYITENWPEVSELGRFELDTALYVPSAAQGRAISGQLSVRSQLLTYLAQGIVQMFVAAYDNAYDAFDKAIQIRDISGRELLYVLRGNASMGNYNRIIATGNINSVSRLPVLLRLAREDFSEAGRLNPNYSRAFAGLATALYLEALRPVSAQQAWDQIPDTVLDEIEATFQRAVDARDRPETADIPIKATFGKGQIYLLRYLRSKQDQQWADKAKQAFQQVIAEYGSNDSQKNARIREYAAESYARLGLLLREANDFDGAVDMYQKAIDTSQLIPRRDVFKRGLLEIEIVRNRTANKIDEAAKAYDDLLKEKLLPSDTAAIFFQKGKMFTEASRAKDAASAYEEGVIRLLPQWKSDTTHPGDIKRAAGDNAVLAAQLLAVLGDAYYDLGQPTKSVRAYQDALALDPEGQKHLQDLITKTQAEIPATPAR